MQYFDLTGHTALERENARPLRTTSRVASGHHARPRCRSKNLRTSGDPPESTRAATRTTDRGGRGAGGADWAYGGSLRGSCGSFSGGSCILSIGVSFLRFDAKTEAFPFSCSTEGNATFSSARQVHGAFRCITVLGP